MKNTSVERRHITMTIHTANHVRPRPGARTPERVPTRRSAELHPDQRGQQPGLRG